jgi:hypothetical protein
VKLRDRSGDKFEKFNFSCLQSTILYVLVGMATPPDRVRFFDLGFDVDNALNGSKEKLPQKSFP